MANESLVKAIIYRLSKSFDISYITIVYFIFAYIIGYYLDIFFIRIFGKDYEKRSNGVLILEVLLQIVLVGIVSYFVRNIVYHIPSPFNRVGGLVHVEVKELTDVSFFPIFIMMFQYALQDKLLVIRENLKKSKDVFQFFDRSKQVESTTTK